MGLPPLKISDEDGASEIPAFEIALKEGHRVSRTGAVATIKPPKEFVESLIKGDSSDAEFTVGNWLDYDDGAVSTPTDSALGGTGGTPTVISVSRTTVTAEVLGTGAAGFKITKTAADGQGEGTAVGSLFVPRKLRGKTVQLKFDYETDSNYVADYYRMFAIVQDGGSQGLLNVLNNGGGAGSLGATPTNGLLFTGSITLPDDVTLIRIAFHGTSTDATAFNIFFANIRLEEISTVNGPVISEWTTFTPSWTGLTIGNGIDNWEFRRVGDSMHIRGNTRFGSTTAITGDVFFVAPTGVTPVQIANQQGHGTTYYRDSSTPTNHEIAVARVRSAGDPDIQFLTNQSAALSATAPFTWADTDRIEITMMSFKVEEFDSGAITSTAQANVTVPKLNAPVTGTQTGITGAATVVEFAAAEIDNFSGFDAGNNRYEIPSDGDYFVHMNLRTANLAADGRITLAIRKNTSLFVANESGGGNTDIGGSVSGFETFVAGDLIDVTVDSLDTSWDILAGDLTIFRVPDFTVFGLNGTKEYLFVELSTDTSTSGVSGTVVDIVGATLPLTPGTWTLGYSLSTFMDWISGSSVLNTADILANGTVSGVIANSLAGVNKRQSVITDEITTMVNREFEITITKAETVKLTISNNLADTAGKAIIFTGAISGNHATESLFWARREA